MPNPVHNPVASLRVFLEAIVDYAGLFAPASLNMSEAVANYARYRAGAQAWALGRFVVPVARLEEFVTAREETTAADERKSGEWKLSGIIAGDVLRELTTVEEFNRQRRGAMIDVIELRVGSRDDLERLSAQKPANTVLVFEVAPEQAGELLPYVKEFGARAKLRTGGVVQQAFPEIEQVADFIVRCAELELAFKATAGLHHPLRCTRALTYEASSPEGLMHGFLNVFTAAAIAWSAVQAGGNVPREKLESCLADTERADWHFSDEGVVWSGESEPVLIGVEELRVVREKFALSFGSCSFEEPILELGGLELI